MNLEKHFINLRYKIFHETSIARIHGFFVIITIIVMGAIPPFPLWVLPITLLLWILMISIKKKQMTDIVRELMLAKTHEDFRKFRKKYKLKDPSLLKTVKNIQKLSRKIAKKKSKKLE